jgi:hypothetical protein
VVKASKADEVRRELQGISEWYRKPTGFLNDP